MAGCVDVDPWTLCSCEADTEGGPPYKRVPVWLARILAQVTGVLFDNNSHACFPTINMEDTLVCSWLSVRQNCSSSGTGAGLTRRHRRNLIAGGPGTRPFDQPAAKHSGTAGPPEARISATWHMCHPDTTATICRGN